MFGRAMMTENSTDCVGDLIMRDTAHEPAQVRHTLEWYRLRAQTKAA